MLSFRSMLVRVRLRRILARRTGEVGGANPLPRNGKGLPACRVRDGNLAPAKQRRRRTMSKSVYEKFLVLRLGVPT